MSELLQAALEHARRGWRVLPLKARSKQPLIHGWDKKATTDLDVIRAWWSEWPEANVGIATGRASGLAVLDVDGEAGQAALQSLVADHGALPATWTARTGSGTHYYFAFPTDFELRNSASRLGEHLDVRGEGGYVVAPPSIHPDGSTYRWTATPDETLPPFPPSFVELLTSTGPKASGPSAADARPPGQLFQANLDRAVEVVRAAQPGTRNDTLNREAFRVGRLVGAGRLGEDAAYDALHQAGVDAGLEPAEVDRTLRAALDRGGRSPLSMMRTDYGNAERLVHDHGQDLRYVPTWKQWLIWDSGRWRRDATTEIMRRAKTTVRRIHAEVAQLDDPDEAKLLASWAARSESRTALESLIALAGSEPGVVTAPDEFDQHPWLLNCRNGTLDLRSGELREHRREDLLTRRAPVSYDPDARCAEWDDFLDEVTGNDPEMITYLQRAVGYTLVGAPAEEVLFFVHGPAATGKSTFVDAVRCALGGAADGYAATTDFETFLKRAGGSGIRNDLARLEGARAVFSSEVEDGKELAEGVVKALTGGDTITARFLYREFFEFVPQFTLWLVANHQPKIASHDEAMWRRVKVVPFTHVVPASKRRPELKARLRDPDVAGAAILAWAVRGCRDWSDSGLPEPAAVREATRAYREEMDPFRGFVGTVIVAAPGEWIATRDIRPHLSSWLATTGGMGPLPDAKALAAQLRSLGAERVRRGGVHGWRGITIRPEAITEEAIG